MYDFVKRDIADKWGAVYSLITEVQIFIALVKGTNYGHVMDEFKVGGYTAKNGRRIGWQIFKELPEEETKSLNALILDPDCDMTTITSYRKDKKFWIKKAKELLAYLQNDPPSKRLSEALIAVENISEKELKQLQKAISVQLKNKREENNA